MWKVKNEVVDKLTYWRKRLILALIGQYSIFIGQYSYRLADTGHTELMVCGDRGEWEAEVEAEGPGVKITHQVCISICNDYL